VILADKPDNLFAVVAKTGRVERLKNWGSGVKEKIKFEVRKQRGSTWDTLRIFDKEDEARKFADVAFADRSVTAINIVKDWTRADGKSIENIIHSLSRALEDKPMQIQALNETPVCEDLADYYSLASRLTIARLMKQYLDDQEITATEIIHSFREGKRLLDKDALVSAAVAVVSGLQAKAGHGTAVERRKAIYDSLDAMLRRARDVENTPLPKLKTTRINDALAETDKMSNDPQEQLFLGRVTLARAMSDTRGYFGKLDCVMSQMQPDTGDLGRQLLDEALGELLVNNAVIQEILGNQKNLATALIALFDIATGKAAEGTYNNDSPAAKLNAAFTGNSYPGAKSALVDWITRQLKGNGPLDRRNPHLENEGFDKIFKRFCEGDEWLAGGALTEAVTLRYGKRVEEGGTTGRRKSIEGMAAALEFTPVRISYLFSLLSSDMGKEFQDEIIGHVRTILTDRAVLQRFFGRNEGITDKLRRITRLHALAALLPIEPDDRTDLQDMLDTLLARYLAEAKIIENMDDPTKSLRMRATRILQFCNSGVLPAGKALKLAQTRMIEHLRRPNFEEAFIEGITDPSQAANALKDFHIMLRRAGLI
jgi:hypothetical protein